jgi:uncharacterized protein (TIGR03067 family)
LQARLTRRGLAVSSVALTAGLSQRVEAAPPELLKSSVRSALRFGFSRGEVADGIVALAKGELRRMRLARLVPVAVGVVALALLGIVIGLLAHHLRTSGGARDDRVSIRGVWHLVSAQREGVDFNDPRLIGTRWRFEEDRIVQIAAGVEVRLAYRIDPTQVPRALDVTILDEQGRPLARTLHWAYKLDGDTLTICTPPANQVERPKELASRPGSGMALMVFRRQPADREKDRPGN